MVLQLSEMHRESLFPSRVASYSPWHSKLHRSSFFCHVSSSISQSFVVFLDKLETFSYGNHPSRSHSKDLGSCSTHGLFAQNVNRICCHSARIRGQTSNSHEGLARPCSRFDKQPARQNAGIHGFPLHSGKFLHDFWWQSSQLSPSFTSFPLLLLPQPKLLIQEKLPEGFGALGGLGCSSVDASGPDVASAGAAASDFPTAAGAVAAASAWNRNFAPKNDPNTFWERSMLLPGTCIFLRLKSQLDFVHLGACWVWSFDYESRSGYKLDIQIMSTYSQIDVALMTQIPIIIHTWRLLGHTLNKVTSSVTNFVVSLSYWTSTITQQKSRMSCIILLTSVNVTLLLCLPSTNIWPVDDPYQSFGSKLSRYITAASTITYRANINYHLEYR